MNKKKLKLVVLVGPTASGKTKLAVSLARQFNGGIISADSRQVYRGMDIGTGKDLAEYGKVPYRMIDVADPQRRFTLAQYKEQADAAIAELAGQGRLPFLVGGSGLYLQAVVDNFILADHLGPDQALRTELEKLDKQELFQRLETASPDFAKRLNDSDKHNKRRLIRYLELGRQASMKAVNSREETLYDCLVIGLRPEQQILDQRIRGRLLERLENEEMIGEVQGLLRAGLSSERLKEFGLEYRFITEYLEEKYGYQELVERLFIAIRQFSKRQATWFRRWEGQGRIIHWVNNELQAVQLLDNFKP